VFGNRGGEEFTYIFNNASTHNCMSGARVSWAS